MFTLTQTFYYSPSPRCISNYQICFQTYGFVLLWWFFGYKKMSSILHDLAANDALYFLQSNQNLGRDEEHFWG